MDVATYKDYFPHSKTLGTSNDLSSGGVQQESALYCTVKIAQPVYRDVVYQEF